MEQTLKESACIEWHTFWQCERKEINGSSGEPLIYATNWRPAKWFIKKYGLHLTRLKAGLVRLLSPDPDA